MRRAVAVVFVAMSWWVPAVPAAQWHLSGQVLIDPAGRLPSLWDGTIAYTNGPGGAIMYYDGTQSVVIYTPAVSSWDPVNANGSVAWRNLLTVGLPGSNEIFRWDGQSVTNVSNSPGITDSDLAAGSNGDLIWSRSHAWLMYYDASENAVVSLDIPGVHPCLHITDAGITTYAYQDPDTDELKYYDGAATQVLGQGSADSAFCSIWDGAVAWIGNGSGEGLVSGEVFYWRDGQAQRITDDDAGGGIADRNACLWKGVIVWARSTGGSFAPPELFVGDGTAVTSLNTVGGYSVSYQGGQVAWVGTDGLYLATVVPPHGDCDVDGDVDLDDLAAFVPCLTGPALEGSPPLPPECGCSDFDEDGDVDLVDFAGLQVAFKRL